MCVFKRSSHKMDFGFSGIYKHLGESSTPSRSPPVLTKTHTPPHPSSPPCRCTWSEQSTVWLLGALHPQVLSSGSFSKHGFLPLSNSVGTLRNDCSKHALALQSWRADDSWNALFFLSFFFFFLYSLHMSNNAICAGTSSGSGREPAQKSYAGPRMFLIFAMIK